MFYYYYITVYEFEIRVYKFTSGVGILKKRILNGIVFFAVLSVVNVIINKVKRSFLIIMYF